MISRLNSDSADKWAQELFQLGDDQADDQKRARMQVMAIQMVAQGDPEFGLKLLHQIKPVAETDSTALVSANMISAAASAVFQGLCARQRRIAAAAFAPGSIATGRREPISLQRHGRCGRRVGSRSPAWGSWFQRGARFADGVSV